MPYRILLVDDKEISRRGIKTILAAVPDWEICGEATDGKDAIEKVRQLEPDLVIIDAIMPTMSGIEAVRRIRQLSRETRIVMLSMHDSESVSQLAKLVGADIFLTKEHSGTQLNSAIASLMNPAASASRVPSPTAN